MLPLIYTASQNKKKRKESDSYPQYAVVQAIACINVKWTDDQFQSVLMYKMNGLTFYRPEWLKLAF